MRRLPLDAQFLHQRRAMTSNRRAYNPQAAPFYPTGLAAPPLPPPPFPPVVYVRIANFARRTERRVFERLIESIAQGLEAEVEVVEYDAGDLAAVPGAQDLAVDAAGTALLETSWAIAPRLIDTLQGYEWCGLPLEAMESGPRQAPAPGAGPPVPYADYGAYYYPYYGPGRWAARRSPSLTPAAGLPQVIMNLVAGRAGAGAGDDAETLVVTDGVQPIKVNPRRLFVGNIPFTTTWPALKAHFVETAAQARSGAAVEILRVEIPMQPQGARPGDEDTGGVAPRMMSRGFAIVTTDSQRLLQTLIELFDEAEFEGRKLTVRFDRFPDYKNYMLQQVFSKGAPFAKPLLSNLAYERHQFERQFYYGAVPPPATPGRYGPPPPPPPQRRTLRTRTREGDDAEARDAEARDLVNSFRSMGLSL